MAQQQKDMNGILFPNDKTGGNPNWPDYKGSAVINGQDMWLSAWVKKGQTGQFISLAFKVKEAKAARAAQPDTREKAVQGIIGMKDDDPDGIPF